MREILEGVYMWSRLSEPHGYDFNGYFLRQESGNIVVDPVEPSDQDLAFLRDEGVAEILLTNRNHSRAANALREATGAHTLIHRSDADHAQRQGCIVDEAMSSGELHGELQVVPAKGKSPGEIALYWARRGILILGDAVIGNPPGRLSLLPEDKLDDPGRLRDSLRALAEIDFEVLLLGDGVPILQDAKARLAELVAGFPDRAATSREA